MPADSKRMILLPSYTTVKAPETRFTGDIWVDSIIGGMSTSAATAAMVHFAPGARTAWHRHSNGQTLHVTQGCGLVVDCEGQIIRMHTGDTVYTPPDVWHWHGATQETFMTHLALSVSGGEVEWGEHVADSEYQNATAKMQPGYKDDRS
ncbi:MAG: (R)-mandelonitrile lyase [Bifidobacterium psychraerophilum]